ELLAGREHRVRAQPRRDSPQADRGERRRHIVDLPLRVDRVDDRRVARPAVRLVERVRPERPADTRLARPARADDEAQLPLLAVQRQVSDQVEVRAGLDVEQALDAGRAVRGVVVALVVYLDDHYVVLLHGGGTLALRRDTIPSCTTWIPMSAVAPTPSTSAGSVRGGRMPDCVSVAPSRWSAARSVQAAPRKSA